ncbi:MAG: rhomboid family intramembrane serine protease [Bacteroidales bacterium]|nr:rhomboid family intramembrane serine protease [Bacteroidales bacterium]
MQKEERALLKSFFVPFILLALMYLVAFTEWLFGISFSRYGIHPLHADGLPGILLSPFIHSDWKHLAANSLPVLVLGGALFYFYQVIAVRILLLITLLTGIWVWLGARGGVHIGASGVIYGLSSFLLVSGIIRRETRLMALSLIVVFLYGSFVWGIFPQFFPQQNISWESHLSGMLAGIILAVFYRSEGPQRKLYSWEIQEEDEDQTDAGSMQQSADEKPYWDIPEPDRNDLKVVYHPPKKES